MTFNDYIDKPQSKKITIVEIDTPLEATWLNYAPGIWYAQLTSTGQLIEDDFGNFGYWANQNTQYYNIQSLNVGGELYSEKTSIALVTATEKTWFYDTATSRIYIHFEDWSPPEYYSVVAPGAAIGFTNQIDDISNNYFEDVYYEPLIQSIPNMSKKKDSLFFGILQYLGGTISFNNTGGYFDDFATLDLYGQPVRIKLSFEGLDISEQQLVYTGKVEDFQHDFNTFRLKVADIRKLLSRKYPVNTLSLTTYPNMDSKLDGTPIPIAYGSIINAPAYKTTNTGGTETFKFCDTTFNAVTAGISVVDKDGAAVTTAGTETDGTFTTSSTEDNLYVTFDVSITNGLDIISDLLENYENITFNSTNYDLVEWAAEKIAVPDMGLWIGKGNLLTSVDVIEKVCTSSQGIFDVLADGKFTFRTYNADRAPTFEYYEDELLDDPVIDYDSEEYLTSVKIEHSEDILNDTTEIYTNDSLEAEVQGRYRNYRERSFETLLTAKADAITLSDSIMEQSKFIYPKLGLTTKTQNVGVRILDNILYSYQRQSGSVIVARSIYQVLGVTLDLTNYEIRTDIKQIQTESDIFRILDGGDSSTDYDYYDVGSSTTTPDKTIDGGNAA